MITFITLLRIVLILPIALLLLSGGKSWLAAGLFVLGGVTDWLDGWLARRTGKTSLFGAVLDQICDKVFIIAVLILMVAAGLLQQWMLAPVLLIVMREFAVAGWRDFAAQTARPVPVDGLGKIKTVLQFAAIALMLLPTGGDAAIVWLNHAGAVALWLAAIVGIISAVRYIRN